MQKVTEIIAKLKEEAVVIIATTVATLVPTFVLGCILNKKITTYKDSIGYLQQEVQGFGKIVNENKAAIQGLNTEGDIELAKPNINNDNTESSDDNMNFESIKSGTGADGVGVNEERIEVDLSISSEKESSSDDDEDLGGEN